MAKTKNKVYFFKDIKQFFYKNEVKLCQDVIISSVVIKKQSIAQLLRGPTWDLLIKID